MFRYNRLPPPSTLGFSTMTVPMGLDDVLSTLHIGRSCCDAMAISGVGACGAGVHAVETQSMGPAVKHVHAIVSDHMCCHSGWSAWH